MLLRDLLINLCLALAAALLALLLFEHRPWHLPAQSYDYGPAKFMPDAPALIEVDNLHGQCIDFITTI